MVVGEKGTKNRETSPYFFILPTLLIVGFFTLYPFFYAIYMSLTKYVIYEPNTIGTFVGLKNYEEIISSTYFNEAVINTLVFTMVSVIVIVGVAFAIALILNQGLKGSHVVRVIMLIPWAIPPAAAGLIWRFMFQSFGWINKVFVDLGFWNEPFYFLSAPRSVQIIFAVTAQMWQQLPFCVLLLLAVLQIVPKDVIDSSEIDGAVGMSKLRYIMLPYLKSALAVVAAYQAILALTTYDMVYTFAGGTYGLISYYAFAEMFQWGNFGHGAALAVILAIMTLLVILIILRIVPPEKLYRYSFTGE
ncbi:Trehalose transport system permease protein SugA [Candidatus Calditenuaceae archaeon HR02]|nr:Trehalose transport system permease protein SugA [Candidatus Calditenuaceae archaeon HR02]